MQLSIVIPAYNEQERLPATLSKIHSYFNTKKYEFEVIVVDDGSVDDTKKVALGSSLHDVGKLHILSNRENKGKGFSVKRGMRACAGDYILFSDADLSTPIEEVEKLFCYIRSGFDIAIGSRSIRGSDVKVHQPFYREWMGKAFNLIVQHIVLDGIVDTQCGFKLFRSDAGKDIASLVEVDGFAFDVEILYLAKKLNYKVKEVPVVWINSPLSKVNPVYDSCIMFKDLYRIKRLHNGV
ncbi:dolichyl-phosphate beta-glucosyltransferase [Candidatus Omnitrophota bacterium]